MPRTIPDLEQNDLDHVMKAVLPEMVERSLKEKGRSCFASKHETLGLLQEEYKELVDAVQDDRFISPVYDELLDIAVACVIGMATIRRNIK